MQSTTNYEAHTRKQWLDKHPEIHAEHVVVDNSNQVIPELLENYNSSKATSNKNNPSPQTTPPTATAATSAEITTTAAIPSSTKVESVAIPIKTEPGSTNTASTK